MKNYIARDSYKGYTLIIAQNSIEALEIAKRRLKNDVKSLLLNV